MTEDQKKEQINKIRETRLAAISKANDDEYYWKNLYNAQNYKALYIEAQLREYRAMIELQQLLAKKPNNNEEQPEQGTVYHQDS